MEVIQLSEPVCGEFDHIPEVEPDEWDLEMLAAAEKEATGQYISFADVLESLGLSLEELDRE